DGPDGKGKNKNKNNKKNPGKKQGLPKLWETIKRIFTPKPGSKPHKPGVPGGPNGNKGTLGKIFDFGKKILGENPGNMLKKIGKGAMKGGKKLLGPISIILDIVDIATASPEERPAAITSAVLGSSLTTAGAAIAFCLTRKPITDIRCFITHPIRCLRSFFSNPIFSR
ncbi:hypothetical protein AM598_07630, partial [Paenibacillus polymyxa]